MRAKPRDCLNFVPRRTFKNKVTLALRHLSMMYNNDKKRQI